MSDPSSAAATAPRTPPIGVFGPGSPAIRLFLTSTTLLFVELLLIRWIPANVVSIGFFSNFILMGTFLGMGIGILYGRGGRRIPQPAFSVLLLAIVTLISTVQLNVQLLSPNEVFFGLAETSNTDIGVIVLPLVVALVTVLMASLAFPLGELLTSMPPLRAYAIDIAGSMTGIAGFAAMSAPSDISAGVVRHRGHPAWTARHRQSIDAVVRRDGARYGRRACGDLHQGR